MCTDFQKIILVINFKNYLKMKKKKFIKKLSLSKETIANLNEIKGGINLPRSVRPICIGTCTKTPTCSPTACGTVCP